MIDPPSADPPRPWRDRVARFTERAAVVLAGASLVVKVGLEAGLPGPLLGATSALAALCVIAAWLLGRGRGGFLDVWRCLLALSLLASVSQVYPRVGGDGFEYFMLARSLVFDQDLDFSNEFAPLGAKEVRTATGELTSRFPIGLALLWIPPLLACRFVALALASLGVAIDTTGFGTLYQAAATTTSFALAALGLFLLDGLLRRLYPSALAGLCVLAIWLATPLYFYAVGNPSMSHAASAFAATLVAVAWLGARHAGATVAPWLGAGVAGALMSLIRIQDAALMAVPALDCAWGRRGWRAFAALFAGPALAAALQLGVWWAMHGAGFLALTAKQGNFGGDVWHPLDILLSARHGFLTWTPLYVLCLAGILLWLARDARLATALLLGIVLGVSVNGLQSDWWGSDAFGQRRLLGLTPLLALGLAEALAHLRRHPLWIVGAGLAALAVWNQQFAYIYNAELLARKGEAVSLDRLAATQVDLVARRVVRLEPVLPAWVFVYLYDNLRGAWLDEGPRPLGPTIDLGEAEPEEFPVVGHGWSPAVRRDGASFRFSSVRRSWLRVPVLTPGSFRVTVRARAAFDAAPVSMSLEASGKTIGQSPLEPDWQEISFRLPAGLLTSGVNHLGVAWSVTPADVMPGFRGRNAAGAVDWIRFERVPED